MKLLLCSVNSVLTSLLGALTHTQNAPVKWRLKKISNKLHQVTLTITRITKCRFFAGIALKLVKNWSDYSCHPLQKITGKRYSFSFRKKVLKYTKIFKYLNMIASSIWRHFGVIFLDVFRTWLFIHLSQLLKIKVWNRPFPSLCFRSHWHETDSQADKTPCHKKRFYWASFWKLGFLKLENGLFI